MFWIIARRMRKKGLFDVSNQFFLKLSRPPGTKTEKDLFSPFSKIGHNFFNIEYFFLIFVLYERWEWDLFKNDVFMWKNAFQNSLPVPYQNPLFVENAFLTQNMDFHGNSTDIEPKTPLEYRCIRSEMIPLWFLNAKTTSPSPRECIWVVTGTEIDISASTRNWCVPGGRDTFKVLVRQVVI